MRICVQGLWHLGAVTAACLADLGHRVIGLDPDAKTVADLALGKPPLFEPGLAELTAKGLASGNLSFSTDAKAALAQAELVWVTFDTPVDDEDRADVEQVTRQIEATFPVLAEGAVLLISSQLPVGTARRLADSFRRLRPEAGVSFAVSPENLRLGKAIEAFMKPERIVIGLGDARTRPILEPLLKPLTANVLWMRVESAEMVKHALNAFLAASVTFINEIASLGEALGADAGEVEAALRAEPRIGAKAYIRPGSAFAGGTLARDVATLGGLADHLKIPAPLLKAIPESNNAHRGWPFRALARALGDLAGLRVAILGLAYKPGTDAVRRSLGVELARALLAAKADPIAFDPKVTQSPLPGLVLAGDLDQALEGANALVIATGWPEFQALDAGRVLARMRNPLVLDPDRLLPSLAQDSRIRYRTIGTSS